MKKRGKINKTERLEIAVLLERGCGIREIGRAMDRSPGTICDEIKRNSVCGVYDPQKAQVRVWLRKSRTNRDWKKINKNKKLCRYITDRLKRHWNPLEISHSMRKDNQPFYASKTAIYEWLRSPRGQYWCQYLYSRRYYVTKRRKVTERVMIPNRVGIEQRSSGATNRSRYGHWEIDTIVSGRRGSCAVSVMIERKSRYFDLKKLHTLKPTEHNKKIKNMIKHKQVKSITFDNGIENKNHEQLGIPSYFCDPYSSWQKGSVENVNKMIRRFIPKGTNISKISQKQLNYIRDIINNKPRAILGFKSAYDVARLNGVITSPGVRIRG